MKRLIVAMAVSLAILLGWQYFISYMARKNNWGPAEQPKTQTVQSTQTPATGVAQVERGGVAATPIPAAPAGLRVLGDTAPQVVTLGSESFEDETYSVGIRTQSQGASISAVTLNQFPRSLNAKEKPYVFQQASAAGVPSMATLSATVNGQTIDLAKANWLMQRSDAESVTYVADIGVDKPIVRLVKTIKIAPKKDKKTQGYEVAIGHKVENLSGEPAQVSLAFAGPTTPPREIDSGPDRYVLTGFNDLPEYDTPKLKHQAIAIESLKEKKNLERSAEGWPMIWAGLTSTYFNAIVLPVAEDTHRTAPFVEAVRVEPAGEITPTSHDVQIVITTKPVSVAAGNPSVELNMLAFFGPKARAVVKNDYYGTYPRQYDVSLSTTGSCTWCTFQWLVDWMVALLRAFHFVLRDWGLAIIALVILVRALMHPLTRKSTISMHRMSKLAPEIERIKKKFEGNPEEQNRAMMAFYKEHGAGQVLGCLPMFIQMPIWIALYSSLQSTFELRLAPFLWGFTWIEDLAKPDHLVTFTPINLWLFNLNAINILPIGMAVVFWLQQKFTPQPASMTPEQEQQQKMMKWMMVLMFPIMLYNGPSGLNLYIFTSTLVGMLESKWIRDHIKAREAAEGATGPVIIDVTPTRAARTKKDQAAPAKPKGKLAAWWANVQKMAEEAKKRQQGGK